MKPSKYFLILTIHYSRSIYKKEKPVAYIIISTESKTLLSPNKYMRNNYLNHFNNPQLQMQGRWPIKTNIKYCKSKARSL